eukprot:scaffold534809_cov37-Prasinocladus_malaysianus.AAC.1
MTRIRIRQSTISHSSASSGGGIWAGGLSDVSLEDSALLSNTAVVSGAAMSVQGQAWATVSGT